MNTLTTPTEITVITDEYTEEQLALAEYLESLGIMEGDGVEYLDDLAADNITDVEEFENLFVGVYDDEADFAQNWVTEVAEEDIPNSVSFLINHIDWQGVWECELRHEFFNVGHMFFSY